MSSKVTPWEAVEGSVFTHCRENRDTTQCGLSAPQGSALKVSGLWDDGTCERCLLKGLQTARKEKNSEWVRLQEKRLEKHGYKVLGK